MHKFYDTYDTVYDEEQREIDLPVKYKMYDGSKWSYSEDGEYFLDIKPIISNEFEEYLYCKYERKDIENQMNRHMLGVPGIF
jgi:hypothetical protein